MLCSLFLVCCVALFPAKSMVPPRTLSLCVGCVTLCFNVVLFLALRACPPFRLLCGPWPTSWTYVRLCFSSVSALFLSCLPAGLILSFCWSIRRQIIGMIVPANSNFSPWDSASALSACLFLFHFYFIFIFIYFHFPLCSFPFALLRIFFRVHVYMYVPWICPWHYLVAGDTGGYTTAR